MKKVVITLIVIFLCFHTGCNAQNDKFSVFKTREGNFTGQIEVMLCSEDILEYKLTITKEPDHPMFEQNGYALIVDLENQKKIGIDYDETIGTDSNPIPVHQFLVTCNCEKWLNIKVAQDFSVIEVDYGDDLINEISENKGYENIKGFHLGYFYKMN